MQGIRVRALWAWVIVSVVGAGTGGCQGGTGDDEASVASLQRGLFRYYEGPINDSEDDLIEFGDLPLSIPTFVDTECNNDLPVACDTSPAKVCEFVVCTLDKDLCRANKLLDIADATDTLKFLEGDPATVITVPVQDPAARIKLRETALRLLTLSIDTNVIDDIPASTDCDMELNVGTVDAPRTTTWLKRMEARLTLAFRNAMTALDALAEGLVAESDSKLGEGFEDSYVDLTTGNEIKFSGAKLDRLLAASYLGGALTLTKETDVTDFPIEFRRDAGICTASNLSDAGLEAQRLIRESGISPAEIVKLPLTEAEVATGGSNVVTIETLVTEVRRRLGLLWYRPEYCPSGTETGFEDTDFLVELGLRLEDFAEARLHMAGEIRAFARSYDAELDELPSTSCSTIVDRTRYAATVNPPIEAPWLYYTSYGAFNEKSGVAFDNALADPNSHPASAKVALAIREVAEDLAGLMGSGGNQTRVDLANALGRRLQTMVTEELSGAVVMAQNGLNISVLVGSDRYEPNDMIAVTSNDALSCATRGDIEGIPCSWSDVDDPNVNHIMLSPGVAFGANGANGTCEAVDPGSAGHEVRLGSRCTRFDVSFDATAGSFPQRIYILRRLPGASKESPGSYDGFAVEWPSSFNQSPGATYTVSYIMPRLQRRAAEVLTPATSWCARPKWTCAGTEFDARLPLEDELIDDGDAFESSWRNYLVRARRAADEADFFGREASTAIFQIQNIAEDALAEVEDLCGVTVPIEQVAEEMRRLEQDGSLEPTIENAVDQLVSPPDIRRLQQCLGEQDLLDFVGLGSDTLCAWYYGSTNPEAGRDTGTLCRLDDGDDTAYNRDLPCPKLGSSCEVPSGYNRVLIRENDFGTGGDGATSDLLLLFDEPESDGGGGGGSEADNDAELCGSVRKIRDHLQASEWTQAQAEWETAFVDNGFWSQNAVKSTAQGIRWVLRPGDFSSLYANGVEVVSTGDINLGGGVSTIGVCATEVPGEPLPQALPFVCDTPRDTSLVCGPADCATPTERYEYNYRLGRAAVLARWLGSLDLEGFRVPEGRIKRPNKAHTLADVAGPYQNEFGTDYIGRAPHRDDRTMQTYCTGEHNQGSFSHPFLSAAPGLYHYWNDREQSWDFDRALCTEGGGDGGWVGFAVLEGDRAWGDRRLHPDQINRSRQEAQELLAEFRSKPVDGLGQNGNLLGRAYRNGNTYLPREFFPLPWFEANPHPIFFRNCAPFGCSPYPARLNKRGTTFFMPERSQIRADAMLDALELLCEATVQRLHPASLNVDALVNAIDAAGPDERGDFDPVAMRQLIDVQAGKVMMLGNRMVLRNLPREVTEAVKIQVGLGTTAAGQYGEQIARLQSALVQIKDVPRQVAFEIRAFARDNEYFDTIIKKGAIQDELTRIEFQRTRSAELANCAVAIAKAAGSGGGLIPRPRAILSAIAAAAATCANSSRQIQLAARKANLEQQLTDIEEEQGALVLEGQTDEHLVNLTALADQLSTAVFELNSGLLNLENLRRRTRRALRQALFLTSDDTEEMLDSNATLQNQFASARSRYRRARRDATRTAFLARRAIEQRFGVHLDEIKQEMTLVEAPRLWAGELCNYDGIDYSVTRLEQTNQDLDDEVKQFSDGFVGEYVTKLENFVESYRLDFPFQGGTDTAVVSLRDDVQRVRGVCPVEVPNDLVFSSRLDVEQGDAGVGWQAYGCDTAEGPNCLDVQPLEGHPFGMDTYDFGAPAPYRVTFGPSHAICVANMSDPQCDCATTDCGWTPLARYGQELALDVGTYRVSWYERVESNAATPAQRALEDNRPIVRVERSRATGVVETVWTPSNGALCEADADDPVEAQLPDFPPTEDPSGIPIVDADTTCVNHPGGWVRKYNHFDATFPEDVRITVGPQVDALGEQVDIAGLMVEYLGSQTGPPEEPQSYYATDGDLQAKAELCEDTDGSVFRSRGWRRACTRLCDGGFSQSCTEEESALFCYRETDFYITNRTIQRNEQFALSGFARGNFNYRIDSIGLNIVGSSARDCDDVTFGSTCYSAGWIPYTIEHDGPHRVHSHSGDTYRAFLVPGVIEHARGLATQRYLTNPLSSADSQQIGQFMQRQFRGRPLTGVYKLRIWEEPGVNFNGIEDIQILLNYSFWTRQE